MKLILMETGQKTIQTNNSLNQNNIKALSIQISLSGLSFCILNRTTNTIENLIHLNFSKRNTPFEILESLKATISREPSLNETFESVLLIYQNELSCLVPKAFFKEHNLADYLKFNSKILKTDFISFDELAINNSINVFVPLVNINNYIFDAFGAFEYKHISTILIDTILQKAKNFNETKVVVHVNKDVFELLAVKDGDLILYNTYDYQTKEDFIYYILFCMEQLKLDPEQIKIELCGSITKDDEFYSILYKYIRHVEFINPKYTFKFNTKPLQIYNDFVLLNSFN